MVAHGLSLAALSALVISLIAGAATGCGSDRTQIMIVTDTDFAVPSGLDRIEFTIVGPDGSSRASSALVPGIEALPVTLALVHEEGALGPVEVRVQGRLGSALLVERRAVTRFVEGKTLALRVDLDVMCVGRVCDEASTCAAGACRPAAVAAGELFPWTGRPRHDDDGGMVIIPPTDAGADAADANLTDGGDASQATDGGDAAVCVPMAEECNLRDDDCDGRVDEDFALTTDPANCGSCGRACPTDPAHGSGRCQAGICLVVCDLPFADCDSDLTTGCEQSLAVAATCGRCDMACTGGLSVCSLNASASAFECSAACADTVCGTSCVDTGTDPLHCGGCGMACPARANARPTCAGSSCTFVCDDGFFDCDSVATTGCESRQRELTNCGACNVACGYTNAVASCTTGACELSACTPGFGDCDANASNGCETITTADSLHCGGCNMPCASGSSCAGGMCRLDCAAGTGDCDNNAATGCETDLLTSNSHCGMCASVCRGGGRTCQAGNCIR